MRVKRCEVVMSGVLRLLCRVVLRIKVTGDLSVFARADHLLIVSRLGSWFDALLLGLFLPQSPVVIVPTDETRSRLVRWMLRHVAHHAIDMRDPAAVKRLVKMLRAGARVALFPEGRVAGAGAVMKIYPVPALVALRSGAAVVPVIVERPHARHGRGGLSKLLAGMRSPVTIRVLTPTRIEGIVGGSARRRRAHATRRLTGVMQSLALASFAPKPLFDCFLDACAWHGRRAPLIEDARGERQTYGELLRASLALARLARRFTAEREIVGVLLPNVAPTVAVVLGLSAAGRVPAMLNYTSGPRGIDVARTAACVRTVITSRRFVEQARLQPLLDALTGCKIIYLEDARGEFGLLDKLWLLAFALHLPRLAAVRRSALDPAVVLFTSGSEGRPKGVVLSHHAVVANVAQIRAALQFAPADKILNPLPLYHAYSFTAGMILPLVTGTRLYLHISPLHYRAIPEIAYRRDCTVLFGTSTLLAYYASNANPMDFCRLRYVISGGEKLSPEVARLWMEKFGLRIFDGYGCTECAPVIALATPAFYRSGAVGAFLPDVEYRLEQLSGIETGRVLHVRGPNLMLGYLLADQPGVLQPPRSELGAGWHDTGDIVDVDEDGIVTISGRARRFAKIAGEMVSLDQIEQIARHASPEHHHAAVVSTEDISGESTVLFTTDPTLDRVALQRAARQLGTQDLAVARRVVHVPDLPLLGNGKTDYVTLGRVAERASRDVTSP